MAVYGTIHVALSNQAHRWFVAKLCSVSVAMPTRGTGRDMFWVHSELYSLYADDTLLRIIRSVCLCVQYNCSPATAGRLAVTGRVYQAMLE